MKYKVHRLSIPMTDGEMKLERFLNGLSGEVIAINPTSRRT